MTSSRSTETSLRLFVALAVPTAVRAQLATWLEASLPDDGRLRRTRPEGWHITLAFLGATPADKLRDVVEVVSSVLTQHPLPDRIHLGPPGRFGHHTLWIGADEQPPGCLGRLGAHLQDDLSAAGLSVTRRKVAPHITVARARRRGRIVPADVHAIDRVPDLSWEPSRIETFQSHLGDGPARYRVAASVISEDTGRRTGTTDSDEAD